MSIPYIILSIIVILSCIALMTFILMQDKKAAGLGNIAGMGSTQDTYWDKNKGRSLEGTLERYSKIGGAVLFILSIIMCIVR